MSLLVWVIVGILVYWLGVIVARRRGLFPDSVKPHGPLLSIHTSRGRAVLNRLATPRRFWRAWANVGVGLTYVVMVLAFVFLLISAASQMQQSEGTAVTQPRNVLVIPGVNEFLPLSATPEIIVGLLVGLVVHEGGHGLLCRVEDIEIESMGVLLLGLIPLGAFVEPDTESRLTADRGGQTRMFAAGVTNNFVITLLTFGLLFGPVAASIAIAPGVHVGAVLPGSAAEEAGIETGDRITAVAGHPVENESELNSALARSEAQRVVVEVNGESTVTVQRRLLVTGVAQRGPSSDIAGDDGLLEGDSVEIVSVNGTAVSTRGEFRAAVRNRTFAELSTSEGIHRTVPIGVLARVNEDGPLATASDGTVAGETVVITHIAGTRVIDDESLGEVMATTVAGSTVTVRAYVDGSFEEFAVSLGDHPEHDYGFLGVAPYPGFTGITLNDFGVRPYPSRTYLGLLGGGGDEGRSFVGRILAVLIMPIAGVAPTGLPFNFAGFTGGVAQFYVVSGPLAFLGRLLFVIANVLFWTGWINFNLAFFNCIPGYPLDGGHILRNLTESVVSRLPISERRRAVRAVTTTVGVTMLASLILMLFGQGLLV